MGTLQGSCCGNCILDRYAHGFEQRDLIMFHPTRQSTQHNLTQFTLNVILSDETLFDWDDQVASFI